MRKDPVDVLAEKRAALVEAQQLFQRALDASHLADKRVVELQAQIAVLVEVIGE